MVCGEFRELPLGQLKPAPYHPRRVLAASSAAYRKLKASVAHFGLVEPLVWNERTGHVVGGHLRLRIVRELGFQEVPVAVVRLDEVSEKALNIVLNNPEAQGRYHAAQLANLVVELDACGQLPPTGLARTVLSVLRLRPASSAPRPMVATDRVEMTALTDRATDSRLTDQ
ncbi:MAG: ParB N-terminal domain-containing protein [Gemmataceae bacterium]|nr:ParB N-terminal domain-containing protein [Gemmata sp.]MDW8197573.1 ParB N-terminal domain-containing protein [Gemmataceae bacterium]